MRDKNKKREECKHSFVKYPPKIGKLKVCAKCGFLWAPGGIKSGNDTVKISGSGNYIETQTISAPASPVSGKVRVYAASSTSLSMVNSSGTVTDLAAGGDLYNFLTNPGFEIWQRGAGAFTATGAYTCDRHYISLAGTDTISITQAGAGQADTIADTDSLYSLKGVFTLGNGAGASAIRNPVGANLTNNIENAVHLRGRTIAYRLRARTATAAAVRAYIRTDGTGGTTTESAAHTGGGAFESLDVTITVPTDAVYLDVGARLAASSTFYMDNETLVIGSVAQTYYPLHPADEWERCQRYYEVHGGRVLVDVSIGGLWAGDGSLYSVQGRFMTRKAVTPTITKSGTWIVANCSQPSPDVATVDGYRLSVYATAAGYTRSYANATDGTQNITSEANP